MSTASVLYKTRRVLGDMGETFSSQIAGDGQSTRFELPEDKLDLVTVVTSPSAGGSTTVLNPATDYALDTYNGVVVLTVPVPVGTLLTVTGTTYQTWPDADLLDYVTEALALHTATRNPTVVLDPVVGAIPPTLVLPYIEERPLALLAASLVVNDQVTDAAKDITIDTGDGTVIPRGQRYTQLTAEATRLEAEYQALVEKLGIPGFDTLSVSALRRVSMTTNRLVPEYVAREWDDRDLPKRVLPLIQTGATVADAVVIYRGLYNSTFPYQINDLVDESGMRYICTAPCTGVDPSADVAAGTGQSIQYPSGAIFGAGLHWSVSYVNSGMPGWYGGGW